MSNDVSSVREDVRGAAAGVWRQRCRGLGSAGPGRRSLPAFGRIALFLLMCSLWPVAMAGSAAAQVSITNRDDREHKLTLIEGEAKQDRLLKPNETALDLCAKGCILRLNDNEDDEYQLEVGDVVSIEDGFLYYDGPEEPTQQGQPGAQPAPEPKKQ